MSLQVGFCIKAVLCVAVGTSVMLVGRVREVGGGGGVGELCPSFTTADFYVFRYQLDFY